MSRICFFQNIANRIYWCLSPWSRHLYWASRRASGTSWLRTPPSRLEVAADARMMGATMVGGIWRNTPPTAPNWYQQNTIMYIKQVTVTSVYIHEICLILISLYLVNTFDYGYYLKVSIRIHLTVSFYLITKYVHSSSK